MIRLPRTFDSGTRDALAERLKFYRDLGLTDFYRRPVSDAAEPDGPSPSQAALQEAQRELHEPS